MATRSRKMGMAPGLALALVCAATSARAQMPPQTPAKTDLGAMGADRPWARGVSMADQKAAVDLFREGNGLLKESLFVQAAAKYREALRHWNHPGVHYNLALALLNLDQPVEVFAQLEEAMKYGAAPLDQDKFEHAGRYKALIEKQLARVTVSCGQADASVTLDGQPLFTAPGHYEGLVRVGQHTIVATKPGYIATQKAPILLAGQKVDVELMLYTADDLTRYRRRWHQALPYSVLVGGVVLAGVGGILHWQASSAFNKYDDGIAGCAVGAASNGCTPDATIKGHKSTGESLQTAAFVGYGVGGAAVAIGAVLAGLNRAQPYRVSPDQDKLAGLSVTPLVGPGTGGVSAKIHF